MKILIVRFSSLGDVVLSTPVPRLLRGKYPDSVIHFITKKEYCSVYYNNKSVDKVIEFNNNLYETILNLRREKYDLVIDLHNNLRSNFLKLFLIKPHLTYNKQFFRRWIYTNFKILTNIDHISTSYVNTLSKLDIFDDGKGLDFNVDKKEITKLNNYPLDFSKCSAVVIGAKHFTKRLPEKKIIELCDKINGPVALIGGKQEMEIAENIEIFFNSSNTLDNDIRNKLNKKTIIYNFCGKLSIQGSAGIIKLSKNVFTHDTGFMHIASALDKKIFVVFGSTHHNLGFYPYQTSFSVIENKSLHCRPCTKIGLASCPVKHFKCMNDIKFDII